MAFSTEELDQKRAAYKAAAEAWVGAIQAEVALTANEHSVADLDAWDAAEEKQDELADKTRDAKGDYEDALREEYFNF